MTNNCKKELESKNHGLADAVKFVKAQQWQNAYYSIMVYVAFIVLFSLELKLPAVVYRICQFSATLILLFFSTVFIAIQLRHRNSLKDYREKMDVIQSLTRNDDNDDLDYIINKTSRERYDKVRAQRKYRSNVRADIENLFNPIPTESIENRAGDFRTEDKMNAEKVFRIPLIWSIPIGFIISMIVIWFDNYAKEYLK